MAAFPPPPLATLGTCLLDARLIGIDVCTNLTPRCRMEQAYSCSHGWSVTRFFFL